MTTYANTGRLLALALRRDRLVVALSALGVAGMLTLTAVSYTSMYATAADRQRAAETIATNASLVAIAGPARALDTIGGLTVWKTGLWAAMAVGLISALLAVRHTRGDEERGQTELVLATATGRDAPLAAALALVAVLDALVAVLAAAGLAATGVGIAGALAVGGWLLGTGLVFGAVGIVAAQLAPSARGASGLAAAALGAAFALRAVGDTGDGALTWLSPLGWGEELHAFADERWWPLALFPLATGALVLAAQRLLRRRDLGSGIVPSRPGPPRAAPALTRPLGLALRLQRASLLGWAAGLFVSGLGLGGAARSADDLATGGGGGGAQDIVLRGGGDVRDEFFAAMIVILALVASAYAVQATLRPRGDETTGRAELLLATSIGRLRWAGSHLALAIGGSAGLLLAAGLGLGIADALSGRGADAVAVQAGATLAQAPAVWTLAGVTMLLLGAAPRATALAWAAIVLCLAIWVVGPVVDVPSWVLDVSPFQHLPAVPAAPADPVALLALTAIAAALVAGGLAALRRRDVAQAG
ncbi:Multidrug efflux system permease protein [Baekduia alba]|uniref:ABC transporter permease n=1 Tax=Baekduia alba TaxID=2997333 RepID=UPI002340F19C|nr:hypothetical protein [Baekduia alba]WCB93064.1 Multidrug efflux system permease protein [Baekduia alba]